LIRGAGIKLILETDAIIQPLTGIGRYALELLRVFQSSEEFSDIKCLNRGRWYEPGGVLEEAASWDNNPQKQAAEMVRPAWRRNPLRRVMGRLLPYINQHNLEKHADSHIYHSPNYKLSPFAGKKVATFHDLSIFLYPQYHPEDRLKVLRPAIEHAAQVADHLITDSQQVRQEVMSYFGIPGERVTAIPLATPLNNTAIDYPARDQFLTKMGLRPDGYILFVSTLEPRKNISGLLGAYELLPSQLRQRYPLVLAGQLGWKSQDISRALDRAKRRGDVIQPGYLSNAQIRHLYAGARAFVFPSFYEGFGLPLLEAQSYGVPVISSDCSCMPEVAGDAAILVNPEAYSALADAMQQLIEDDQLHASLSSRGIENAGKYSWENTAEQTMNVYRSLM